MTDQASFEAETAACARTAYEAWLERLEKLLQITQGADFSLDGDRERDGYSLDCCFDLWREGKSPLSASEAILWRIHGLHRA